MPRAATPRRRWTSHVARKTVPTCRSQYPGGPCRTRVSVAHATNGGLPRPLGGSASTSPLSRPAQDSLALRPARLRSRLSRDLSPRLRHGRLPNRIAWVATEVNRKLLGRIFHPLVLYTFRDAQSVEKLGWSWLRAPRGRMLGVADEAMLNASLRRRNDADGRVPPQPAGTMRLAGPSNTATLDSGVEAHGRQSLRLQYEQVSSATAG